MPVALLGVPFDAKSSDLRGPAQAPSAIRHALASSAGNSFTESVYDVAAQGVLTDHGDLHVEGDDLPLKQIESAVAHIFSNGANPLVLGGDHSISWPVLRAVRSVYTRLSILHIDAHSDLYDAFEGDRHSHACPFARIMEEELADRLVQVGIRTLTPHQRQQADRFGVEVIDMQAWAGGARPRLDGPIYISLDLDALDPAFAPGVSHREPGGFSTRDVIGIITATRGDLIGADLVELNPERDVDGISATVAAKLTKELIGLLSARH